MVRRIEGRGNGKVDYDEFVTAIDPIIVKMHDIQQEQDQGDNLAHNKAIHKEKTTPFIKKMRIESGMGAQNSLGMNLEIYDQQQLL